MSEAKPQMGGMGNVMIQQDLMSRRNIYSVIKSMESHDQQEHKYNTVCHFQERPCCACAPLHEPKKGFPRK